jgi:hypothetical protein
VDSTVSSLDLLNMDLTNETLLKEKLLKVRKSGGKGGCVPYTTTKCKKKIIISEGKATCPRHRMT